MANTIVIIIFQISDATPKLDSLLLYLTPLIFICLFLGAYLFCDLVYCLVGSTCCTSFLVCCKWILQVQNNTSVMSIALPFNRQVFPIFTNLNLNPATIEFFVNFQSSHSDILLINITTNMQDI